jgi:hypothetical protein
MGENLVWWKVNPFDGRDVVTIRRLDEQLVDHCVDQNLGASFEAPPFDVLRGIVEFKRFEDVLAIDSIRV